MFEAEHTGSTTGSPEDVWALWADPERWPEWNEQLESGELRGDLAVGTEAAVKFKRGGRMVFEVVELEEGRLFVDESKLPGCRFGHEHRVEPGPSGGATITHRLYLRGLTSGPFSLMFGRKRMRASVVAFVKREAELTGAGGSPKAGAKKRGRRRGR